MFPERIETERLLLEPRTPEYVGCLAMYEYCSESEEMLEVTKYTPWSPHATPKETLDFLREGAEAREEGTVADFVIRPRDEAIEGEAAGSNGSSNGDIAGFCGLRMDWDRNRAEMGIWLRKQYWGRGYSGERAAALFDLAFDKLDLEIVRVTHHPDNEKSRRAVERYIDRFGGQQDGVERNAIGYADGTVHDQITYSISQQEWTNAVDEMDDPPQIIYEWDR